MTRPLLDIPRNAPIAGPNGALSADWERQFDELFSIIRAMTDSVDTASGSTAMATVDAEWNAFVAALKSGAVVKTPPNPEWFSDLLGDAIPDECLAGVGSGTGNAVAISAGLWGRVEIKTASNDGAHSANGSSLSLGGLNWRADQGGLMIEARIQIDDITDAMFFVGFTDTLASTVEAPLFLNAGAFDSDATDAAGVVYDTDGTTEQFAHGGVKADVDTTPAYSGSAPVNATYVTVRVEISAAGAVTGYIDGTAIGDAVADAVTVTTPLTPIVFAANRAAAARNVLIDYLWVQGNR